MPIDPRGGRTIDRSIDRHGEQLFRPAQGRTVLRFCSAVPTGFFFVFLFFAALQIEGCLSCARISALGKLTSSSRAGPRQRFVFIARAQPTTFPRESFHRIDTDNRDTVPSFSAFLPSTGPASSLPPPCLAIERIIRRPLRRRRLQHPRQRRQSHRQQNRLHQRRRDPRNHRRLPHQRDSPRCRR